MKTKTPVKRRPATRGNMVMSNLIRVEFLKLNEEAENVFVLAMWKDFIPSAGDLVVIGPATQDDGSNIFRVTNKIFYFDAKRTNTRLRMIIKPWIDRETSDDLPSENSEPMETELPWVDE